MNHLKLNELLIEERSFGSSYDSLLNGVAQGLARLFPPVDDGHLGGDERAETVQDPSDETVIEA